MRSTQRSHWAEILIVLLALVTIGGSAVAQTAPTFTSTTTSFQFQIGVARNYTITTSGSPTPVITHTGPIPPGVTFTDNHDGTGTLGGTAEPGTQGGAPSTLTATNSAGTATLPITVNVVKAAEVVSPDYATFVVGSANTFDIYSDAEPFGTISVTGALPAGLTLGADNGFGTIILSGTPATGSAGVYPLQVTATNSLGTDTQTLQVTVLAATPGVNDRNYTGMYYDTASSGWAVNLTHQGNTLVAAWYTFAQNERPVWFIAATTRQSDGSFSGNYTVQTGQPFNLINGAPALVSSAPSGTVSLRFSPTGALDFRFEPIGDNLYGQRRSLTKLVFAANPPTCRFTTASRATATNYTDLWWQPSESGWGVSVVHQGDLVYIAWYTYAADGQPVWLVALLSKQEDGSYFGPLNRANSGGWYYYHFNQSVTTIPLPVVGNASVRFTDGQHGVFVYTVGDITQIKAINRIEFGSPLHVCATP